VPAIKGYIYINTLSNSQPALIKLDNENIGGHLTPLHLCRLMHCEALVLVASVNIPFETFFQLDHDSRTRGHTAKLKKYRCNAELRRHFFFRANH